MLRLDLNVVWTIINLLIIYGIARIFLFKPVKKVLAERQAEIDKQYADAREAQEAAGKLKTEYEESLSQAAAEKTEIITEARRRAGGEYEKIVADANAQAEKIIADARKAADKEQERRLQQAREQVADLVVAATAKLVAVKQNTEADRELYNQFIAKTGEKRD